MSSKLYDFSKEINKNTYFNESKGFGIIDFNNIPGNSASKKALFAGNWNLRESAKENYDSFYTDTPNGIKVLTNRHVLVFKAAVPDFGTYEITVTCKSDIDCVESLSIFTGRRNLVCKNVKLSPNSEYEVSFNVNITPYIPALTYIADESKYIYVSILGQNAILSKIEVKPSKVNTIFIAGDSTLTDQNAMFPYYPIESCAGWAQDLTMYVKNYAVCNYAHSGLTTNCFKDDGHWDILKNHLKPGDFVILQFGHNDQKRRNLQAFGGYLKNLNWYINEIRSLNATPIICSPISRVPITDSMGTYSLLQSYAKACKKACIDNDVVFIDLHKFTFDMWTSLQTDEVKNYFIPKDITHTNDYGAILIADFVAKTLHNTSHFINSINDLVINEFGPEYDTKEFPVEISSGSVFDIDMPFMDISNIPKLDKCKDAFKKGLMDPCVMNMHPDSFLPRAQLLMIYLRAIRKNGSRPYVGNFDDIIYDEWDSSFVQTCINENLIDPTTVSDTKFRPDDLLTYGEFSSFCIRGIEPDIEKRNISISDCFKKACSLNIIDSDTKPNDYINRLDAYCGLARLIDLLNNKNNELPTDTEMHPVH